MIESIKNLNLSIGPKSKLSSKSFFADINLFLPLEIASDFKLVCDMYLFPSFGTA
jgi:hypothetical protein